MVPVCLNVLTMSLAVDDLIERICLALLIDIPSSITNCIRASLSYVRRIFTDRGTLVYFLGVVIGFEV